MEDHSAIRSVWLLPSSFSFCIYTLVSLAFKFQFTSFEPLSIVKVS